MKTLLLIFGLLAVTLTARAQQGSLTLLTFESFTFADKYQTYYGYGRVEDGFSWGAGLEFGVDSRTAVELIYQNFKADAYYDDYLFNRIYGQGTFNYIMLGGTSYAPMNEKVSGFGSFDLGMCIIHPSTELAGSLTAVYGPSSKSLPPSAHILHLGEHRGGEGQRLAGLAGALDAAVSAAAPQQHLAADGGVVPAAAGGQNMPRRQCHSWGQGSRK